MPFDTIRLGSSAAGAYEIERSLRFDDPSQTKLNFTPSSAGNRRTFTLSFWCKPTQLNGDGCIFEGDTTQINGFMVQMNAIGTYEGLYLYDAGAGSFQIWSDRRFRDQAWYHFVIAVDTTQGTDTNRFKVYINGVQQDLGTWNVGSGANRYPSENADFDINQSGVEMQIGKSAGGGTDHFQGYLAEFHSIDGTQLAATSFGETNDDTGQWVPIKYAGSYGTNGFYLNFKDNSNTTATTLGKDYSGNGHNWTPTNFSVAAGVGHDSSLDSPTNNWCTINGKANREGEEVECQNGGLYSPFEGGTYGAVSATQGFKTGKWYWEITTTSLGSQANLGVCNATWNQNDIPLEANRNYQDNGNKNTATDGSNTATSSWGASYTDGDVIGVAVDMSAGTITFYKNGSSQGAAYSDLASALPSTGWIPMGYGAAGSWNWNFGQRPFAHTPPADHLTLCAQNIPEPTVPNGTDYFNSIEYTGNDSSDRDITGVGFQPDLLWIKNRSQTDWHIVQDSVRGANKALFTNVTNAESTDNDNGHVNSFLTDGFNVTAGDQGNVNENGESYVAWNWKESAVAGFDIVSYTGTGSSPQTRAHSLGVAPEMIIVKSRSGTDGDEHWAVYHHRNQTTTASSAQYWARLNTNGAFEDLAMWNDTAPTSSVFTTQNHAISNANTKTFIAYVFAGVEGYSQFGRYIGTGSQTTGPFVYTGFQPQFLLVKKVSAAHWHIHDNIRNKYNPMNAPLYPNDTPADEYYNLSNAASLVVNFHANGFQPWTTHSEYNANDSAYIYAAFAERPFKYSNAV